MAQNRGEWSELYSIVYLLINNDLIIKNEHFEEISNNIYRLKGISVEEAEGKISFNIEHNGNISVLSNDELRNIIDKEEIERMTEALISSIVSAPIGNGSFNISDIDGTLNKLCKGKKIKAKASLKEDLTMTVLDNVSNSIKRLKYSIKSMLGSPATLLNASLSTNFIYEVKGLTTGQINEINLIKTKTKLLDKCKRMMFYNADICFVKTESENFEYNLKMIDSKMPEYMAKVLFTSYSDDCKDLKKLFLESTDFIDDCFALNKLGQFLEGISFGFFPNKKWDGNNYVDGGLIIVSPLGEVGIMDLIYHRESVRKYLINETKLESPSSTRYKMFEIYKENNKYFFKLNLQIRYKK